MLQRTQLIKNASKCPNIWLIRVWQILAHFRRHVIGSSLYCHCMISSTFQHFWYSKIPKFGCVIFCQKYILGFQISVENLSAVNIFKRQAQLYKPIHYFSFWKFFSFLFLFPNVISKISIFTKLHDYNQNSIFNERMFVRNNIWMI